MSKNNKESQIMNLLLKDIRNKHTISNLSKEIGLSRQGTWKIVNKLKEEDIIKMNPISKGKTGLVLIELNFDNSIVEKRLALILTEESIKKQKWISNFKELENLVDFLIIYGSILHSPNEAEDIDLLSVVSGKKDFKKIDKIIQSNQKIQLKKIHIINLTKEELESEIKKLNNAYIDAIYQGIVLFGQDNFIKFIKNLK